MSGGMLVHGGGFLSFWSRGRRLSWENELYAAVSTRLEALVLQSGVWEWRNTCTRDAFGCKRLGMKAGWMW